LSYSPLPPPVCPSRPAFPAFLPSLLLDRRLLDLIELRKIFRQVRVALGLNLPLLRSAAARGTFTVAAVQLLDDVHARCDFAEGWKPLLVERRTVVLVVDEELRRAGIGAAVRKGHDAAFVALLHRLVRNPGVAPCGLLVG